MTNKVTFCVTGGVDAHIASMEVDLARLRTTTMKDTLSSRDA